MMRRVSWFCLAVCLAATAQEPSISAAIPANPLAFDLLLRGGHVIDDRNGVDALRDVGIKDGRIAAVAAHLDAKTALKTVDATGFYVTPGLIDIHVHAYAGTGERGSYAGDKLVCQLTLRDGKVVYDLNGISADAWDAKQHSADVRQKDRWTTFNERPISKSPFPVSVPVGQLAAPK